MLDLIYLVLAKLGLIKMACSVPRDEKQWERGR